MTVPSGGHVPAARVPGVSAATRGYVHGKTYTRGPITVILSMADTTGRVSIKVQEDTWERIRSFQRPGDTHDDIISAALDAYEQSTDVTEEDFRDFVTGRA